MATNSDIVKVNEVIQASDVLTVKGKVTDEQGEPLPVAIIVIKGTTKGVITGFDGEYSFSDVPQDAVLVCSFIGFTNQEKVINGQNNINWVLKSAVSELEDVTVVAFGIQKKESIISYV